MVLVELLGAEVEAAGQLAEDDHVDALGQLGLQRRGGARRPAADGADVGEHLELGAQRAAGPSRGGPRRCPTAGRRSRPSARRRRPSRPRARARGTARRGCRSHCRRTEIPRSRTRSRRRRRRRRARGASPGWSRDRCRRRGVPRSCSSSRSSNGAVLLAAGRHRGPGRWWASGRRMGRRGLARNDEERAYDTPTSPKAAGNVPAADDLLAVVQLVHNLGSGYLRRRGAARGQPCAGVAPRACDRLNTTGACPPARRGVVLRRPRHDGVLRADPGEGLAGDVRGSCWCWSSCRRPRGCGDTCAASCRSPT